MATTTTPSKIERVTGRALPVRGNDIDTDRIIPARYLKTITFEGIERGLFEDDRKQLAERRETHAIDVPAHQGATLMIVQANFGCGSSREHAPQAIVRWGIRALVGESFGEIFFGNALVMGLPCVTASAEDVRRLLEIAERHPETEFDLDLATSQIRAGDAIVPVHMPDPVRAALRSGEWDATGLLMQNYEEVERIAAKLPYLSSFGAPAR